MIVDVGRCGLGWVSGLGEKILYRVGGTAAREVRDAGACGLVAEKVSETCFVEPIWLGQITSYKSTYRY